MTAPERSHREIQIIFVGLMLGMLLPAMNSTIVATALPAIVTDLGSLSRTSWVVTSYLVAATVSVPVLGQASDLFGRRRLFLGSIVVFVAGSVWCGLAVDMPTLIAGRVVQGLAGGGLMALAQATIGEVVSPRERGRYTGYIGSVFAIASVVGPPLGGLLVDEASWRWIFHLNVPLGLLALAVTHRFLRIPPPDGRGRVDVLGSFLVTVAVTALLLIGLWGGQQFAWRSPVVLGLVILALGSTVVLVPVELRHEQPVVPVRLFRGRIFTVGVVTSMLLGTALFGATVYMPTFLQIVNGVSATASGLALLAFMTGMVVTTTLVGRRMTATGRYRRYPIAGTAVLVVGFGLLASLRPTTPVPLVVAILLLIGSGVGSSMQVMVLAVQNAVAHRQLGVATSSVQLFRMVGGTLGLAVFGTAMTSRLESWAATRAARGVLPPGLDLDAVASDQAAIAALEPAVRTLVRSGVADAISHAYLLLLPGFVVALVLALSLREIPLRTRVLDAQPTAPDAPSEEATVEVAAQRRLEHDLVTRRDGAAGTGGNDR